MLSDKISGGADEEINSAEIMTYIAEPDNGAGERIDKFLSDNMADRSEEHTSELQSRI